MKRLLALFLLVAALAAPSPSAAQITDGAVKEVKFISTSGSLGGIHLPFYNFEITGMPGTPYWDFLCVDNLNYINYGDKYRAQFTAVEPLSAATLNKTREGSDKLRLGGSPVVALAEALNNYRIAAYLYLQVSATTNQQKLADLQRAVWFATNPSYVGNAASNAYYVAAQAAVTAGFRADGFFVVTAVADVGSDGKIRATGGKQEYLFYQSSSVPEPGTFILLGTGLLGVAFVGRRRRKLTDLDAEA